jgi:hypothetical protein
MLGKHHGMERLPRDLPADGNTHLQWREQSVFAADANF